MLIHPQYVVDATQTRTAVLIPVAEWEQILEVLEDMEDIQGYDAAKAGSQETIPFTQALHEIELGNQK